MTFNKNFSLLILSIILIFNFGCKAKTGGFSGFEDITTDGKDSLVIAPKIESWAPVASPINLLAGIEKTFSVTVSAGAGTVSYKYVLDSVEKQSSVSPLYTINTSTLSAGAHSLVVTATNSAGSDTHTFSLLKNTPPTLSLISQTATTIDCSSGSYTLNVLGLDAESDAITYSFLLNGASSSSFLTATTGTMSASVVFTPNCTFSGSSIVAIKATDSKGDSAIYSTSILVTNPFSATITSFSPITDPTVVLSTASTNFSIVPSGTSPFTYNWVMTPGSTIASCNNLSTCPLAGSDFTAGRYSLTANVNDARPSSAAKTFTVVLNQKPQVTATPSNASTINMNCANIKNFNLSISDANFGDSTQTFSVVWKLNGSTNSSLTNTTVLATNPMTSQAVFTPNCNSALIGAQSVSAVISDGHESVTFNWPLNVNYFSEACNNLTSGQICTALGRLGMNTDINLLTQGSLININPWQIEKHSTNAYFIADNNRDGIWFYNSSGSSINVLGVTVPNNRLKFIAGQGAFGSSLAGSLDDLYLYDPRGMAYNSLTGELYVADYSNSRILKIDSTGAVTIFAGSGSSNTDGDARTSHKCNNPNDLILDTTENKLFVTCYGNSSIGDGALKYFMTNSNNGYTLVKLNPTFTISGVTTTGVNINGTNGYSGVGQSRRAYGLSKHPNKRILFFSELESGHIMAVSYGDTDSFYNNSLSLAANNIVDLTPNSALGNTMNLAYNSTDLRIRPYDLVPKMNGARVEGIFFNNYNDSVMGLINLSGSNIKYGGQTIAPNFVNNVIISGGSYARGATPSYSSTYMRNPFGMILDGNDLIVADVGNGFVSKMSLAGSDTPFVDIVGYETTGTYDGETSQNTNDRRLNRPAALIYRSNNKTLYVNDEDNYRVRRLDLTSGAFETVAGSGAFGNASANPSTSPFTAGSHNMTALALYNSNSILLYADNNGTGTNRNCNVRALNFSGSDQNSFGQVLENNKVRTVLGNYSLGCQLWDSVNYEGQVALSVALNYPTGLLTNANENELYVSDRSNNCVLKVVGDKVTSFIGTCSTAAATNSGNGGVTNISTNYLLTNPGFMKKDNNSSNTSGENFFLVYRSRTTLSEIKYVNRGSTSVTINYVNVGPNEIKTVLSSLNYLSGIATFEDQLCYSQGAESSGASNVHNVECINRTTGTTTIRIGRSSALAVKAKIANYDEQEGIHGSSATLSNPFDIEFDGEGNLWITDTYANNIRKVKKWF